MIATRLFIACFALIALNVFAQTLPPGVAAALARAKIPLEDVGIVVKEVGAKESAYLLNADKAMNPELLRRYAMTFGGFHWIFDWGLVDRVATKPMPVAAKVWATVITVSPGPNSGITLVAANLSNCSFSSS